MKFAIFNTIEQGESMRYLQTIFFSCLLLSSGTSFSQLPAEQPLYPNGIKNNPIFYQDPDSVRYADVKKTSPSGLNRVFKRVMVPTFALHAPEPGMNRGVGVVICPGGGYRDVWFDREGNDLALVLKKRGVTSLVLKYRTNNPAPNGPPPLAWDVYQEAVRSDAREAVRILRRRAGELKLDPRKIGIGGFSAGGHLALLVCFNPDKKDTLSYPNFAFLIYPGVPDEYKRAIGKDRGLPPMFVVNARDDDRTPPGKCMDLCARLLDAKVPFELHLYNGGGHGFDLGLAKGESVKMWTDSFAAWMKDMGFLPKEEKGR
jgi:acetyl esterase/lipase